MQNHDNLARGFLTGARTRAGERHTTRAHLEDAIAAADVKLSDEEIARLEEPYVPHPVLGHG